jgi:hypothetical protein
MDSVLANQRAAVYNRWANPSPLLQNFKRTVEQLLKFIYK